MSGPTGAAEPGTGSREYVKFGDACTFFDNAKKGFMFSELSTDGGPYSGVFVQLRKSASDPGVRDFQTCRFEIVAPEKYKQAKELAAAVRKQQRYHRRQHDKQIKLGAANRDLKSGGGGGGGGSGMVEMSGELSVDDALDRVKSRSLKELAIAEARDNELEQRRRHGLNVTYGQVVQLWHPHSRRFVQVSPANNSLMEPSNMKVELSATPSRECYFRIMPRYKVRSVGDLICVNDEIVLECEKSRGQFIHCSQDPLSAAMSKAAAPLQFLEGNYEVNLSVAKASFLISVYSSNDSAHFVKRRYGTALESFTNPSPNDERDEPDEADVVGSIAVQSGTVVQLFHKDSNGYLSAEGLFSDRHDVIPAPMQQDIHLRVRHPDAEKPSRMLPPTSAVTYFMIEKVNPAAGGVVMWEERIRLKHVVSQRYLTLRELTDDHGDKMKGGSQISLQGDGPSDGVGGTRDHGLAHFATLTEDLNDLNTHFKLHPLIRESEHVPVDAYTRIENAETHEWLHIAERERRGEREELEDGANDGLSYAERMKSIRWDGAQLREVGLVKAHYFDDAFSLAMVPSDLVYFGNYLAGAVPMLRQYCRVRRERELSSHEANVLAAVLYEMKEFMFVKGIEQKRRQKRLRDYKVIELLIDMLQAPFSRKAARSTDPTVIQHLQNESADAIHDYDQVTQPKHARTMAIMNGVFMLLESFLTGDSRKNELYMGQHIPFLWELFGTNMRVEPMFNEMIRDNITLIMEIHEAEIKKITTMLETDKNADFLEYLSVLCVCEGAPFRQHQTTIGKLLLDCKAPPVFLTEVMPKDDKGVINIKVSQNGTWNDTTTLAQFARSALDEDETTSTPEYLFLQGQLELYGNLCLGRHETNINFITTVHHHLTWEECFICSRSAYSKLRPNRVRVKSGVPDASRESEMAILPQLPQSLRRIYVNLMCRLFIDVGDNRDIISEVELAFDWDSLTLAYFDQAAADDTVALSGASFPHFPEVLIWINAFLTEIDGHMVHSHPIHGKAKNELIVSVLQLLKQLVQFGYYTDEYNIKILMKPLSSLIDGMNDFDELQVDEDAKGVGFARQPSTRSRAQSTMSTMSVGGGSRGSLNDSEAQVAKLALWRKTTRYQMDDNCRTVVAAKYEALDCIDALYKLVFNIKLRTLLCDFKLFVTIPGPGQTQRERELKQTNPKDAKRWAELQEYAVVMKSVLDSAASGRAVVVSDVVRAAMTTKIRDYLSSLAAHTNWLTPNWTPAEGYRKQKHAASLLGGLAMHKHAATEPTLIEVLLDLAKYRDHKLLAKSVELIESIYSANEDIFALAIQAVTVLTPESKELTRGLKDTVPKLAQLTGTVISADLIPKVTQALGEYTMQCFRRNASQETYDAFCECPPHEINQNIIYNSGLLSVVLDIIEVDHQCGATLEACFRFLRALCRGFPIVQNLLALDLDKILTTVGGAGDGVGGETWENVMARTVTEVFNGCKETCLRITEAQVEKLLELLADHTTSAPSFLEALEAVAKVEEWNLPLKRNQQIIIKSLWSCRAEVIDVAHIDDESSEEVNAKRLALLGANCPPEDLKLQVYHLNLVRLLASTCEGENRQIEAMCRSIFTLDELLKTISSPDIPHQNKEPYISFLLWVYLNTASSPIEVGTSDLNENEMLYRALERICREEIGHYFTLNASGSSTESFCASYAFDTFVPCLQKLADQHFPATNHTLQELMKSMACSLSELYLAAMKSPGAGLDKYRLFDMTSLFATLKKPDRLPAVCDLSTDHGKLFIEAYEMVSQRAIKADAHITSDANRAFAQKYADENQINRKFNVFVAKLREAYCGANTIHAQIGADQLKKGSKAVKTARASEHHVDLEDPYCDDPGEDEALPLGPEFQELVEVFYDPVGDHVILPHLDILVRLFSESHIHAATYSSHERLLLQRVNVKMLQVLRAAIHNKEKLGLPTTGTQAEVSSSGVILPITRLLESKTHAVRKEGLAMLKTLLNDGLADAQREFVRHFLGTREETFFTDVSGLITASNESMLELRTLKQQKEDSDRAGMKLRDTMRTTVGNTMGRLMKGVFSGGTTPKMDDPAVTHNPAFDGDFVPMTSGLSPTARTAEQQAAPPEEPEEDFFDSMKDEGNICLVLSVLQGMCEGHNSILQNYLRVQPDNISSTDLVSMCTGFLETATLDINAYMDLLVQLMNTLTEFAQGNIQNQRTIFSNGAADHINAIIRNPIDKSSKHRLDPEAEMAMAELHMACADLLLSMLATNDDSTRYLATELDKILDITSLLRLMRHYTDPTWSDPKYHPDELDWEDAGFEPEEVGFAYFNVLARLKDFSHRSYHEQISVLRPDKAWRKEPEHTYDQSFAQTYARLAKQSATIEVIDAGEVQKIHFLVHPEWREQLRQDAKDGVLNSIDRTSPTDKVRDFVDKCRAIIADMKYLEDVIELSYITRWLLIYDSVINKIFFFLTLAVNFLMIASWKAPQNSLRDPVPEYREDFGGVELIEVVGIVHLVFASIMVVAHFLQHPPSAPEFIYGIFGRDEAGGKDGEVEAASETADIEGDSDMDLDDSAIEALKSGGDAKGLVATLANESLIDRSTYRTRVSILAGSSIAHLLLLGCSILGVAYHGYTFSLCLLHIVKGNASLYNVIEAVRRPAKSLLYVLALMTIFIYIYALVAFMLYRENFDNDSGAYCNDLIQCLATSLRLGLLSGGGIGDALPFDPYAFYESNRGPFARMFFDLTFFILVTIIMLNVVFGIIVDTFSELRDEKSKNDEAMKSECFICSLKASDFERFGNGFLHHVKHEHHMWNYLFFFYHLDQKDPSEFTALEQMVAEKLLKNDYSFFPINRSLEITDTGADGGMAEQVDEIRTGLIARLERSEAREAKLVSQLTTLVAQQQQQQQQQQLITRTTIYEEDRARSQTGDSLKASSA